MEQACNKIYKYAMKYNVKMKRNAIRPYLKSYKVFSNSSSPYLGPAGITSENSNNSSLRQNLTKS